MIAGLFLRLPTCLPVGKVCLFWVRGLFYVEGKELAIMASQRSFTSARLPFTVESGCTLEEWAMCALTLPSCLW